HRLLHLLAVERAVQRGRHFLEREWSHLRRLAVPRQVHPHHAVLRLEQRRHTIPHMAILTGAMDQDERRLSLAARREREAWGIRRGDRSQRQEGAQDEGESDRS